MSPICLLDTHAILYNLSLVKGSEELGQAFAVHDAGITIKRLPLIGSLSFLGQILKVLNVNHLCCRLLAFI